jgi:hypothetical protein
MILFTLASAGARMTCVNEDKKINNKTRLCRVLL